MVENIPKGMPETEWLRVKWLARWMKKVNEQTDEEKLLKQATHIVLSQDDLTLKQLIVVIGDELERRKERKEHPIETLHR